MFGLGNNDDEQRFWNMLLIKAPLTDKELEDLAPFLVGAVVVGAVVVGALWLFLK